MATRFISGLVLACYVALSACASSPPLVSEGAAVTRVDMTELPHTQARDAVSGERPYYLGPLDELSIDVVGIPEFGQKEIQVDTGGNINFPLVGSVKAGGLTTAELARRIESGLRMQHVRAPQVTVNMKQIVSQTVTVDGQVREPGLYPVLGRMTLMRSIASAKGLTEFAKLDEVVILRTVDNKSYAALYSLDAIRRGAYQDPEIYAGDIVLVGTSRGRVLFKNFLGIVPLLTAPLIVALQR